MLGHQYLFVGIPFGSVYLQDAAVSIYQHALINLALRGYKVHPPRDAAPELRLTLSDFESTAYDLLFVRRVRASATLELAFRRRPDRTLVLVCHATGSSSEFSRFGFTAELTRQAERALQNALNQLFSCADIRPPLK